MNKRNISYITATFSGEEKEAIIDWSKIIGSEDLYFAKKDSEMEGGNVKEKLHLTLF